MILTIFGLILLFSPFLALKNLKSSKFTFFHISLFIFLIQLLIALFTQTLHIFSYPVVLILNTAVFLTSLFLFRPSKPILKLTIKPDWVLIFVISIAFLSLYSVHYHYSGFYSTVANPINETKTPLNYPYPYFSDEWYAVAFIKDAIYSRSLPIRDPIWHGSFTNLEMPFHSLLAEITLLLRLNPLTGYVILSIAINLLIIVLIYLFLVVNRVEKPLCAIASLSALYIVNVSSLPGLWTLLPLSLGIVFLLLSLAFYSLERAYMLELSSFLTLIFYPPLAIFIFILIVSQLIGKSLSKSLKFLSHYAVLVSMSAVFISVLFLFDRVKPDQIFNLIINRLFYTISIRNHFISSFPVYYVVPIPILIFATLGLYPLFKEKKVLLGMMIVSLAFWIGYTFTLYRFIIEFERLIIVASILIVITAAFGLKETFNTLAKFKYFKNNRYLIYLQYLILFTFVPLLLIYTQGDSWKKFTTHRKDQKGLNMVTYSMPLANQYLHPDDLKLFSDIKNERFFGFHWKGTVISVATDNIPLVIKDGTISGPTQDYLGQFHSILSCKEKLDFVKQYSIAYVYTYLFDCPGFQIKGKSTEGFLLYKTNLE